MIKHVVVWKLKDHAEGKSKADNARYLKVELESLVSKIPMIRKFEVGINDNPASDAYDMALVSEFATKEDLVSYQNHPAHQRFAAILSRLRETKIVVDYEF